MADPILGVGTTVSISVATPATADLTGFAALTYTAIGNIEKISGDIGGQKNTVTFTPLSTGDILKIPGSIDYGKLSLDIGLVASEAGIVMCQSGFSGANRSVSHAIKVLFPDAKAMYFMAIVTKCAVVPGDISTVRMAQVEFDISGKVVTNLFT